MKKLLLSFMLALFAVTAVNAKISRGYYSIKNNGNGKYINVLGRKTVGFTSDNSSAPGTIYLIDATQTKTKNVGDGEAADLAVEVLRSQGVDLPGYAKRAYNYVPTIVNLVVEKLKLEGEGELFGTTGVGAIWDKFEEGFDYNLYVESLGNNQYRIYGKTPSMKHVVDFYTENKSKVQEKLPMLEGKINDVIQKILKKTDGSGASILLPYSIHDVWTEMVKKYTGLTEPVAGDNAAILDFYDQVLTDKNKVWDFAYYSAIPYWNRLIHHPKVEENLDKLGDYAQYLDKIVNVQPDFRYYIVADGDKIDFISQGNADIDADRAIWTVEPCEDFTVKFDNKIFRTVYQEMKEYYATFYVDFAYTLPKDGKAYKVTSVNDNGFAVLEEITGVIPAQTPVLLMTTNKDAEMVLSLSIEEGTAIDSETNLLKGNDYLIKEYELKTPQVEMLFDMAKGLLGENSKFYDDYIQKYEYLMLKTAGTVNNKYFFGLPADDLNNVQNLRVLGMGWDNTLGFHDNWEKLNANEAFIIHEDDPVKISIWPDVDRDGEIDVADVTAIIAIILVQGNDSETESLKKIYDYDVADVDRDGAIDVADVTALIDIILKQ